VWRRKLRVFGIEPFGPAKAQLTELTPVGGTIENDQPIINELLSYPDWAANQSWLMFGFPQP
jgi:hypothetical protein